jgi:hypothetical protein
MKKKALVRTTQFPSVKLYKNDIDEIFSLFNEYVYATEISDGKYDYDDLEDIRQTRGNFIPELFIEGKALNTSFTLKLSRTTGNWLEVRNRDEFYLQMNDVLRSRKRRMLLGSIVASGLISFAGIMLGATYKIKPIVIISGLLLFMLTILFGMWQRGVLSKIYLTKKHEQPSFWNRNKDDLVKQIVSHIISFGLGLLAAYLLFVKGVK